MVNVTKLESREMKDLFPGYLVSELLLSTVTPKALISNLSVLVVEPI
jgi:hypothetical protein